MGALACAQLDRIEELVERKRTIASIYLKSFENANLNIDITWDKGSVKNGCWATTIVVNEENFNSDKAINNLAMNKIPIRPFFRPHQRCQHIENINMTAATTQRILNIYLEKE